MKDNHSFKMLVKSASMTGLNTITKEFLLSKCIDSLIRMHAIGAHREFLDFHREVEALLQESLYILRLKVISVLNLDDHTSAIQLLKYTISNHGEEPEFVLQLALSHAKVGNIMEAKKSTFDFLRVTENKLLFQPEITLLLQLADALFDAGESSHAMNLYELASRNNYKYPLGILRQCEMLLEFGEAEDAYLHLIKIEDALDHWGLCVLATAEGRIGKAQCSDKRFARICSMMPHVDHFWQRWFEVAIIEKKPNVESWEVVRGQINLFRRELINIFDFRWFTHIGSFEDAANILNKYDDLIEKGRVWDFIPFLYKTIKEEIPSIINIEDRLFKSFKSLAAIHKPIIDRAFFNQEWNRAIAIIDNAEALGLIKNDVELAIKKFELKCFIGDRDAALELLSAMGNINELPNEFIAPVYRFLAEVGNWTSILEDFSSRIKTDYSPTGVEQIIIKSARRSGTESKVLDSIFECRSERLTSSIIYIASVLIHDILYCQNRIVPQGVRNKLHEVVSPHASRASQERLKIEESIIEYYEMRDADSLPKRNVIYFCTNRSYLCGAATALFSALLNNPTLPQRADCFIIAESADESLVIKVFNIIAETFDITINVVNEDVFLNKDVVLESSYGIFTGGATLAKAAYYRIYFVKYLIQNFDYDTAIYLDSDIIVGPSFSNIFDAFIGTKPLMARMEIDKPEVRKASEKHKLKIGSYFNSGVMVFDLNHKDVLPCIEKSIYSAEYQSDSLLFQDQCALNIGFADNCLPMPQAFNYFVDPWIFDKQNSFLDEAAVVHYLDRPKPWDAAYQQSAGNIWLHHWQKLCSILPRDISLTLYGTAAR